MAVPSGGGAAKSGLDNQIECLLIEHESNKHLLSMLKERVQNLESTSDAVKQKLIEFPEAKEDTSLRQYPDVADVQDALFSIALMYRQYHVEISQKVIDIKRAINVLGCNINKTKKSEVTLKSWCNDIEGRIAWKRKYQKVLYESTSRMYMMCISNFLDTIEDRLKAEYRESQKTVDLHHDEFLAKLEDLGKDIQTKWLVYCAGNRQIIVGNKKENAVTAKANSFLTESLVVSQSSLKAALVPSELKMGV